MSPSSPELQLLYLLSVALHHHQPFMLSLNGPGLFDDDYISSPSSSCHQPVSIALSLQGFKQSSSKGENERFLSPHLSLFGMGIHY